MKLSKVTKDAIWTFIGIIGMFLALYFMEEAKASTFELVPSTSTIKSGQEFHIRVFIVPDSKNYTVNMRMNIEGADVIAWKTSRDWIELPVPYYWQDYGWGISRTAGFPGGFSEKTYLGTAQLIATENGFVNVSTATSSMILNGDNKNVYEY